MDQFWTAWPSVYANQLRFLFWNYILLFGEISTVVLATEFYGIASRFWLYRFIFGRTILRRVSQWQVLLTTFIFPRNRKPRIMVDVLTKQDHLYDGEVADFFLDAEGVLTGLLLKDFRRFRFQHFEDDRRKNNPLKKEDYWSPIPGANFVIPYENIANINIRYVFPTNVVLRDIQSLLRELDVHDLDVSFEATHAPTERAQDVRDITVNKQEKSDPAESQDKQE